MNEEFRYMQNVYMITFNTERNEKHWHMILYLVDNTHAYFVHSQCTKYACVLSVITSNHLNRAYAEARDQIETPSLHDILVIIIKRLIQSSDYKLVFDHMQRQI